MKIFQTFSALLPLAFFAASASGQNPGYTFSLLAGRPQSLASVDGQGRAAGFTTPTSVAVDQNGNVFVADTARHTIRKITAAGAVTTFAGLDGQPGATDGSGNDARFNVPRGVATDQAGNVYVADRNNHTVRKITPAGVVSTLAGQAGVAGSADGDGAAAQFNHPTGVAVDLLGNVFVADMDNHLIREISPAGRVTRFAGRAGVSGNTNGTVDNALFNLPANLTVAAGNVYITELESSAIRWISPTGIVNTIAGNDFVGSADGIGGAAQFSGPTSLAADPIGNVFVVDSNNNAIRHVTRLTREVTTVTGQAHTAGYVNGASSQARFSFPYGVALDAAGNLFVTDLGNTAIRKISPAGEVTTLAGDASAGPDDGTGSTARFSNPSSAAVDLAGNVYVADTLNNTIRKITRAGVVTTFAGAAGQFGSADGTGGAARFYFPSGVATDRTGNVYVTESANATIRKITPNGEVTTIAGQAGQFGDADGPGNAARFAVPAGLAVADDGTIFVADQENSTIRKITTGGTVSTVAGASGQRGGVDGTGGAARFIQPSGVVLDSAGNLYVCDRGDRTVRKITPAGVVSTLAGQHGTLGTVDGTGNTAQFAFAGGIAIDRAGTLYVADGNDRVRKITPSGSVTTVIGNAGDAATAGARAQFTANVATDLAGDLYLVDSGNNTIRKAVSTTRLINLSVRTRLGTDDQTPIMGFFASGPKSLLLRAVGPGLVPMGVTTAAADPQLSLFDFSARLIQDNDNWGGTEELRQAFGAVGAFPLVANSKDAALRRTLDAGQYSAHLTATGTAGGVTLLEAYDSDASGTGRLTNMSVRTFAGTGDTTLIAGFVLDGTAPKTVLIRAAGPALARLGLGASGLLADPKLTLFHGSTAINENDNWGGTLELKTIGQSVGAFEFDGDASKDASLLVTLEPGIYTAHVTGANGGTGVALVEIYEVP